MEHLRFNDLKRWIRYLTAAGATFNTVYDIGCHQGSWTKTNIELFPGAAAHLFDVNPACNALHDPPLVVFHELLLSDGAREVEFYETGGSGDSYYKELTEVFAEVTPTRHRTTSLAVEIREGRVPPPDFIKLDTQGSELDFLR